MEMEEKSSNGGGSSPTKPAGPPSPTTSQPPPVANAILSQAVMSAIGQLDTKLAFDMMLLNEQMTNLDVESKCAKEENVFLKEKMAKQTQEMSEMYHYFHGKLDQHLGQIASLEKDLAASIEDHSNSVTEYESQLSASRAQYQTDMSKAYEAIGRLQDDLNQLHAFQQHKHQLEEQIVSLETELQRKSSQFEHEKMELERKNLFEKDRLKKEMLLRMKETKEELLLRTEDQLNTTTKRTMMENDHFMEELSFQSKETEKLMQKCRNLEEEVRALRIKTKVLEANEVVMAKKNYYYQKILKQLQQKGERIPSFPMIEDDLIAAGLIKEEPPPAEIPTVPSSDVDTQRSIEALKLRVTQLEATLKLSQDWVQAATQEKQYLIAQQDEIIQFLCRAIQEVTRDLKLKYVADVANAVTTGKFDGQDPVPNMDKNSGRLSPRSAVTMEDFVTHLPPISVDDMNSEDTLMVLRFLLAKMQLYQQRAATLYGSSSPGTPTNRTREMLEKQLGVELPPIQPSHAPYNFGSNSRSVSPLKHKRKITLQSQVQQDHEEAPLRTFFPNGHLSQHHGNHQSSVASTAVLMAVASTTLNFTPSTTSPSKSPLKKQLHPVQQPARASHPLALTSPTKAHSYATATRRPAPPSGSLAFHKLGSPTKSNASTSSIDSDPDMVRAWSTSTVGGASDCPR